MNHLGYCWHLAEIFPELKNRCCTSCRDDDDDGYGELSDLETNSGFYKLCCRVYDEVTDEMVEKLNETK